jgi:methylamine dehydrogenase accessory protein MauD
MITFLIVSTILLWILILGLGVAVVVCIRQLGEVYLVSSGLRGVMGDGLDQGRIAPDFEVRLGTDRIVKVRDLLPAGGILIFAGANCFVCKKLTPALLMSDSLDCDVVIAYDEVVQVWQEFDSGRTRVVQMVTDVRPQYKVRVTPFAFGLSSDHRVLSRGLVNTPEQVMFHRPSPTARVALAT